MKRILLILNLILLSSIGFMASAAHKMVVPERTWWYTTYKVDHNTLESKKMVVGFKVSNTLNDDMEWHPVIAVDSLKQEVMESPVCWLKEEGSKVWVRMNLTLHKTESADSSDEKEFISTCLIWWWGDEIDKEWIDVFFPGNSVIWNPSKREEYLLYDFDNNVGDRCQWPWSGYQLYLRDHDGKPVTDIEGPLQISGIKEESTENIFNKEKTKVFTLVQPTIPYYNEYLQIVEGIGAIRGSLESYVPCFITWFGFFFAPQSLSYIPAINGEYLNEPKLQCVEEADGSLVFGSPFNENAGVAPVSKESQNTTKTVFDLHGRVVTNPQPGSVYIRGGKKFVAR